MLSESGHLHSQLPSTVGDRSTSTHICPFSAHTFSYFGEGAPAGAGTLPAAHVLRCLATHFGFCLLNGVSATKHQSPSADRSGLQHAVVARLREARPRAQQPALRRRLPVARTLAPIKGVPAEVRTRQCPCGCRRLALVNHTPVDRLAHSCRGGRCHTLARPVIELVHGHIGVGATLPRSRAHIDGLPACAGARGADVVALVHNARRHPPSRSVCRGRGRGTRTASCWHLSR